MNVKPRLWELRDLNEIVTIIRRMDTKHMSVDLRPIGHQTNKRRYTKMETPMIRITTQGTIVTIVKNMDMFLKFA